MAATNRLFMLTSMKKCQQFLQMRNVSTGGGLQRIVARQNEMFAAEKQRQLNAIGRIEKIEVRYLGLPEDVTLVMNRAVSTPYHCAQHLSEGHCQQSALAAVDGNMPWDMHRPLEASCTLQLLKFTAADPHMVNKAFWRTCSFMLGAALQNSFKTEAHLQLHSFPGPAVKTGSFVYDVALGTRQWQPTKAEMRSLSSEMVRLAASDLAIERLEVSNELAAQMFEHSPFKREQLPSIAQQNNGRVVLYRMGQHIDISRGPMVASSRFLGKCSIVAAHRLAEEGSSDALFRIQGVALPRGLALNHVAYGILEKRAEKINPARLPKAQAQAQMA